MCSLIISHPLREWLESVFVRLYFVATIYRYHFALTNVGTIMCPTNDLVAGPRAVSFEIARFVCVPTFHVFRVVPCEPPS